MLLNSNSKVTSNKTDSSNIDGFLEKEKKNNQNKPWSKLGKNQKIQKLIEYTTKYTENLNFTKEEVSNLYDYLIKCLDRKKLQRVKDVIYDVKIGKIKSIPSLIFDKGKRKFTLKKSDKLKSSLKSLSNIRKKTKGKTKGKIKTKSKRRNKLKKKDQ